MLYWDRNQTQGVQEDFSNGGEQFSSGWRWCARKLTDFDRAKGKEKLKEYKLFFMAGTLKSCSSQFAQVHTIQIDLGSIQDKTNLVPVALLP